MVNWLNIDNTRLYHSLSEKERIEQELKISANIQISLLPKEMPKVKGLKVYGLMKPAREVGGDYFDFICNDDKKDRLNICIGDVAGKGIPAGIVMTMVRTIIHSLIQHCDSTKSLIVETNKVFMQDIGERSFMTMIMLFWNYDDKVLKYTSAGHERIIIYRSKTKKCEVIKSTGLPIGIQDDISEMIEEESIYLDEGDKIILYTDGVTEARNKNGEMLSIDNLLLMIEQYGNKEIQNMLHSIYHKVKKFIGSAPQRDDITLVGIQRTDDVIHEKKILIEDIKPTEREKNNL